MKKQVVSLCCWLAGMLIAATLYLLAMLNGYPWIIFVASVLAALDAKRVQIWRYQSDIAIRPGILFVLMLLIGWLILPWYVGLRLKIFAGVAELKDHRRWLEAASSDNSNQAPASSLLRPLSASWRRKFQ